MCVIGKECVTETCLQLDILKRFWEIRFELDRNVCKGTSLQPTSSKDNCWSELDMQSELISAVLRNGGDTK